VAADIVVVGASLAGVSTVGALRQQGLLTTEAGFDLLGTGKLTGIRLRDAR
jgi:hypothetical protein